MHHSSLLARPSQHRNEHHQQHPQHSLGAVASAFSATCDRLYSRIAAEGLQQGRPVRPWMDFAIKDIHEYTAYLHGVVLYKWPVLTEVLGQNEAARMVWEALDSCVLPAAPQAFQFFLAASQDADELLAAQIDRLFATTGLCELYDLFDVAKDCRLGLDEAQGASTAGSGGGGGGSGSGSATACGAALERHYGPAIAAIRQLAASIAPAQKTAALTATCREVCNCVVAAHGGNKEKGNLAADDIIPMMELLLVYTVATVPFPGGTDASWTTLAVASGSSDTQLSAAGDLVGYESQDAVSAQPQPATLPPTLRDYAFRPGTATDLQNAVIDSFSAAIGIGFSTSSPRRTNPAFASLEGCVTAPATMRCLEAQSAYIAEFLPDHLTNGEHGYTLALFQTAVGHLSTVLASHTPPSAVDAADTGTDTGPGAGILPVPHPPPPPPDDGDGGDVEHLRADLVAEVVRGEDGLGLQDQERGGP